MLQHNFRFHGYSSLDFLYRRGQTFRSRLLAVRMVRNLKREDSRAAVVVTKKVLKSAPKRNRVRRRIYEVLRTNWADIKPGYDFLISVYDPDFFDMPYAELEAQVLGMLTQAQIYEKNNQEQND